MLYYVQEHIWTWREAFSIYDEQHTPIFEVEGHLFSGDHLTQGLSQGRFEEVFGTICPVNKQIDLSPQGREHICACIVL